MNKKNNRKGFTIVELVIVIAVIAILAAVLIPTFGNMIKKANDSKAMQEARNTFTEYMIDNAQNGAVDAIIVIDEGKYVYAIDDGEFEVDANGNLKKYETYSAAQADISLADNYSWPATAVEGEVTVAVYTAPAQGGNG